MSNHVTQRMIFTGDPTAVRDALKFIKGVSGTANEHLDLNSIIPMPRVVMRTAELATPEVAAQVQTKVDYHVLIERLAAAQYQALRETGFLTWHDWCLEHWGTIHNVEDVKPVADKQGELRFKSVGTPIVPALMALSNLFPIVKIELEYIDEGEKFIGRSFIANGEIEYRFYGWDDPEAQELRARLWANQDDKGKAGKTGR